MAIKGIQYLVDDSGERQAVLIDLKEHGELWEDIYDTLLVEQRANEPRETIGEVKREIGLLGD